MRQPWVTKEGKIDRSSLLGKEWTCECGQRHLVSTRKVLIGEGAIKELPSIIKNLTDAKQVLIVSDIITNEVAGRFIADLLASKNISVYKLVVPFEKPVADDKTAQWVNSEANDGELFISCGSGTITDLTKYAAFKRKKPFICVATAASMNGYASPIIAITENGLKKTKPADPPVAVVADVDILCSAPFDMTCAGLGDVISKPVSMADWRLASIVKNEPFCRIPFWLIKDLENIYMNEPSLLAKKEKRAISALIEALIYSGISMAIAGSSAPASGGEHLISHTLDMRAQLKGNCHDLHGAQVGVATIVTAMLYEKVLNIKPDQIDIEKLSRRCESEDEARFTTFWGTLAPVVFEEYKKKRITWTKKKDELKKIIDDWGKIVAELKAYLIPSSYIKQILTEAGAKSHYTEIGVSNDEFKLAVLMARTMRSRYTILDLAEDLNVLESFVGELK